MVPWRSELRRVEPLRVLVRSRPSRSADERRVCDLRRSPEGRRVPSEDVRLVPSRRVEGRRPSLLRELSLLS